MIERLTDDEREVIRTFASMGNERTFGARVFVLRLLNEHTDQRGVLTNVKALATSIRPRVEWTGIADRLLALCDQAESPSNMMTVPAPTESPRGDTRDPLAAALDAAAFEAAAEDARRKLPAGQDEHPAWTAFVEEMVGRQYGTDALQQAWGFFAAGWDARSKAGWERSR